MSYDFACLSPVGITIPFEPDPYVYDSSAAADPSSRLVQVLREQENRFFAIFPEAKKAAEYHKRKNESYLTALHSVYALGHQESAQLNHQPYHAAYNSSLGQLQPQDTVSEAISDVPPTSLSHLRLSSPPPEADAYDNLSEFTPVIPNLYYQRRDNKLTHAVHFHQHLPYEEYKPREDNCPSIVSRHKPQPVPPYNRHSRSCTLPYSGQSRSKGPGLGRCSKRRKKTHESLPMAGKLQVNRKLRSFCHGRMIDYGGPLPCSVDKTYDQCQLEVLSMQIASIRISS